MKNILITRSQDNSQELARLLGKKGFRVFFEPLFTVEKISAEEVLQKISAPISAIIITSTNACFALQNSKIGKETKIFTVGPKTAAELRRVGFQNIIVSPRNSAESLLDLVAKESGQILYFRGSVISFDFAQKLKNVRDIIVYRTHEVENFSIDFKKITYDEVMIFSKNSCEIFHNLISRHNLLEYFSESQIICFSQQILEKARELGFKKTGLQKLLP